MKFEVTKEEQSKIKEWLKNEVEPEILEKQKVEYRDNLFIMSILNRGQIYEGAIGGGLTYCFSNTSIGQIFYVEHWSGKELNLTNYDMW